MPPGWLNVQFCPPAIAGSSIGARCAEEQRVHQPVAERKVELPVEPVRRVDEAPDVAHVVEVVRLADHVEVLQRPGVSHLRLERRDLRAKRLEPLGVDLLDGIEAERVVAVGLHEVDRRPHGVIQRRARVREVEVREVRREPALVVVVALPHPCALVSPHWHCGVNQLGFAVKTVLEVWMSTIA